MGKISTLLTNLRRIKNREFLISLALQQLAKYEGVLIDYVQIQLERGEDPYGKIIGTYTRATELESLLGEVRPILPKREGDPYNFQWTGGYFDGMFLKVDYNKKEAVFGSKDEKAGLLESKYGKILGLQVAHFIEAKNIYIAPGMVQEIRKMLFQ